MYFDVSNNIRVYEASQDVVAYCDNTLTLDNPTYLTAKKLGKYLGNIPPKMKLYAKVGDHLVLPFGCLKDLWKIGKDCKWETSFHKWYGNTMNGFIPLRNYQRRALEGLMKAKNGVLDAPCGSGKTQIGLQLIKAVGGRALWLTHTQKLLEQSMARAKMYFDGDFGTITEGSVNIGKDITFATVQTTSKLDTALYRDAFDIVVVDECHRVCGCPTKVMQFYKVISNCNCRYKYGLSATLTRSDNMIPSLFALIGGVAHKIDKSEVGDYIIKARHERVDIDIEYDEFDYLDGDGTLNYGRMITMLSENAERNGIIVGNILKNVDGNRQIVLCHRVAQCECIAQDLREQGVSVDLVVGKVSQKKRSYNADVIVATYSLAKEGLDIPDLTVLHLATPQKNESTTEQSVGRIERNCEGKTTPVCYDYVDTKIDYCLGCFRKRKRILKKN